MRPTSPNADSFSQTARSLANPPSPSINSPNTPKRSSWPHTHESSADLPPWSRSDSISTVINSTRSALRRYSSSSESGRELPWYANLIRTGVATLRGLWRLFKRLTPIQKILVVLFLLITNALVVVVLIYNERIYQWLAPWALWWRDMPGGWFILWFFTFTSAFPPMIGYSTCVTLAGFIYGMKGWFIAASANVIGSTVSFIVCRRYLSDWSQRLAAHDARIAAFTLVVQRDGFPLLCAIRLCPLPYALSNCGLSTIQSIRPLPFALATAVAAPKLLLHVFVGERLAVIARGSLEGAEHPMDPGVKAANYAGVAAGAIVGAVTGWIIYRRTYARARALEAEERARIEGELDEGIGNGRISADGPVRGTRLSRKATNGSIGEGGVGLEHPDAFVDDSFIDDDAVEDERAWMDDAEERDEIDFGQRRISNLSKSNGGRGNWSSQGRRESGDSESNIGLLPKSKNW